MCQGNACNATDPGRPDESTTCTVCISPIEKHRPTITLACKHTFHRRCVKSWILQHRTCPMCRSNAFPINEKEGSHAMSRPLACVVSEEAAQEAEPAPTDWVEVMCKFYEQRSGLNRRQEAEPIVVPRSARARHRNSGLGVQGLFSC
jgi:hypothetical protein